MKKVIKRIFLGVFALVIFALGAGIIPSYYFLEASDYEFENEKIQESVKLVQLSDIHNAEFGKENQRLLKKLKECEPDLIFITGDLINSDENEISPMLDLVKKLREIAPIYFSLGNHEIEYEKRTGIDLTEKLEKAGAKVLEEKFVDVTVKGQKFRIGGLYTVYIPEDYEVHEWDNAKEQAEFLKEMEDTERYKILLSHIPNTWMYYDTAATFDLDLIFTGHAHGGQAILPFVGGLYAPDTIVSREDGSGTRGAFIELFGIEEKQDDGTKVDMTTTDAQITNNTSVMLTTVADNEYAIGYVSLGSLNDSVKALKIDGAEATAENIENGSYKVSRPFNIAVKKDLNNKVAKDFMSFIMSTEGQKVVADEKYIAVADVKDYAGTKPSGSCVVGGSSSVSPLMEKLIEAYKAVNPNASIELQTSDSTTGMTSTIEGSYDIGMASRELKEEEAAELEPTVIATDGIAVVVNNANPLDELSADQVKDIYVGNVSTWDEITK